MRLYTSRVVADWLGISERRVRQLKDEGILVEKTPGFYDLKPSVARYIDYLRGKNSGGAINYTDERAKLVRAKREGQELELERARGNLHTSEDIEAALTAMLLNFKNRMLTIPAKLAPQLCKLTEQASTFDLLKDAIDEGLSELSDYKNAFKAPSGENKQ